MGYCAASDVAAYLKRSFDAGEAAVVEDLIASASDLIDRVCGRSFAPAAGETTVVVDGAPGYAVLPEAPQAGSITRVVAGDLELQPGEWTISGRVLYGPISPGLQNVCVTARFGVAAVPAGIKHACVRIVAEALKPRLSEAFGLTQSWMQDSRLEFAPAAELGADIMQLLWPYRRWL